MSLFIGRLICTPILWAVKNGQKFGLMVAGDEMRLQRLRRHEQKSSRLFKK